MYQKCSLHIIMVAYQRNNADAGSFVHYTVYNILANTRQAGRKVTESGDYYLQIRKSLYFKVCGYVSIWKPVISARKLDYFD
jgi:hypothetical protein